MSIPEDKGSGDWRPTEEELMRLREEAELASTVNIDSEFLTALVDEIALCHAMIQRRNNKITKLVQQRGKWRERADGGQHARYQQIIREQGAVIQERNETIKELREELRECRLRAIANQSPSSAWLQ